jgi:hypothetical protein
MQKHLPRPFISSFSADVEVFADELGGPRATNAIQTLLRWHGKARRHTGEIEKK